DGQLVLKLTLRPGSDLTTIVFEVPAAIDVRLRPDGTLNVALGPHQLDPMLIYPAPTAFQETPARVSRTARYERLSATRFGLRVEGQTTSLPLQIEMPLAPAGRPANSNPSFAYDTQGNMFVASTISDAAGKDDPFPDVPWQGCGATVGLPYACSDIAVY